MIGCGGLGGKPEFGPGTARRVDGEAFFAWNDRGGNDQALCETKHGKGLRFFKNGECPYGSSQGEYALLCPHDADGLRVSVTRSYDAESDVGKLLSDLESTTDALPGERLGTVGREDGPHPAGIVWTELELAAGASRSFSFALAWRFPRMNDRYGRDHGVNYTKRFASAADAADYLLSNRERLAAGAREVPERVFASSLPEWLKTKIVNDQFPLTTCTWFDASGGFSVNESPSKMHGCLGTIDQRTASQGVYTSLFPELDKNELSLFASFQNEHGQIPHDLAHGMIDRKHAGYMQWPDLACSFILQAHRHIHATGDMEFCQKVAGRVPSAVNWVMSP